MHIYDIYNCAVTKVKHPYSIQPGVSTGVQRAVHGPDRIVTASYSTARIYRLVFRSYEFITDSYVRFRIS